MSFVFLFLLFFFAGGGGGVGFRDEGFEGFLGGALGLGGSMASGLGGILKFQGRPGFSV